MNGIANIANSGILSGVTSPDLLQYLQYLPWIIILLMWLGGAVRSAVTTIVLLRLIGWVVKRQMSPLPPLPFPTIVPAPPPPAPPAPPQPTPKPEPPKPEPKPEPSPAPKPAPQPPAGEPTDHNFQAYRADYALRWAAMKILPQHQAVIDRDVGKIAANKTRYEGVATSSGVPWYVIGIIDMMEAGGGCSAHLHNGDPLSGRTIHVPAGRPPPPAEPPFTWEQSVLDALSYQRFDRVKIWDAETVAWVFESMNGFGYRPKGVPSPYLWSFSDQYTSGKFVADHVFDANAVSAQAGAMTLLKGLTGHDPSIKL